MLSAKTTKTPSDDIELSVDRRRRLMMNFGRPSGIPEGPPKGPPGGQDELRAGPEVYKNILKHNVFNKNRPKTTSDGVKVA